ncbi:flavodoxin domain-containing protein [Treponema sp. OttesenSCG-928-L16]|nr:flavodoxin domain-containing protein [Treponema sp. OttesenSCG-928-L16]
MKTLIVYASRQGCTKDCAVLLGEKLPGETELTDIRKGGIPKLEDYGAVIIGASVNAGSVNRGIKKFCQENLKSLLEKKTGIFICCAAPKTKGAEYINENFPADLVSHGMINSVFGGEYRYEKMGFLECKLIKMIEKKSGTSAPGIDHAEIDRFAAAFNRD